MIDIGIFVLLLVLGYGFGQLNERRHYKSLIRRERELAQIPAIASRHLPLDVLYQHRLVSGSVVIASDYFKSFVASLVNIFGGRVRAFETLLDRGRREALLRMKEQAQDAQAELVFNVKYETARIGRNSIEVLCYGTALCQHGESNRSGEPLINSPQRL